MTSHKIAPHWYVAFVLLLVLGVGFRFYNLDKKVFWADETRSALRVAGYTTPEVLAEMVQPRIWSPDELLKFQRLNEGHGVSESLRSLATDDPKHPPLFYVLLRIWTGMFGDSVFAMRLLAVFLSLLTFPAMWWLCRELFHEETNSRLIALVAVALLALSPFHVVYAQEAREYSLWTVLLLASSALLLKALRGDERKWWLAYALSVVVGMYTHTLMITMCLAHVGYVLTLHRRHWWRFVAASALAALLFAPWAAVIWQRRAELQENTIWLAGGSGVVFLVKSWLFSLGTLYFDPGSARIPVVGWGIAIIAARFMRIFVLAVILLALVELKRKTPRHIAAFIGFMIAVPFLALAIPDLLIGGLSSSIGRFLVPALLGIQLAVAYLIAQRLSSAPTQKRWSAVFGLLLLGGVFSCLLSSQAESWWNKAGSFYVPRVARTINASKNPLVVTRPNKNLLALGRVLDPHVRISLTSVKGTGTFNPIFFYDPTDESRERLLRGGLILEKVDEDEPLWRLKNRDAVKSADVIP